LFVTGGLKSIGAGLGPGGTPMQNQANLGTLYDRQIHKVLIN
jgi:hypothetical protein